MSSLTTCDPGDINTTLESCKASNLRCSVISLAAEVRIYRQLTKVTDGKFAVTLDDVHLRDLLHEHLEPPPSALGTEPALIKMGFPSHASANSSSQLGLGLCMCCLNDLNGKLTTSGFLCPQVRIFAKSFIGKVFYIINCATFWIMLRYTRKKVLLA